MNCSSCIQSTSILVFKELIRHHAQTTPTYKTLIILGLIITTLLTLQILLRGRSRIIGIETTLQAGRSGIRIPLGTRDFSLLVNFQTGSVAHSPTLLFNGTGIFSRGQSGRGVKVNHSSAEVKNEWSSTSAPLQASMKWTRKNL